MSCFILPVPARIYIENVFTGTHRNTKSTGGITHMFGSQKPVDGSLQTTPKTVPEPAKKKHDKIRMNRYYDLQYVEEKSRKRKK